MYVHVECKNSAIFIDKILQIRYCDVHPKLT